MLKNDKKNFQSENLFNTVCIFLETLQALVQRKKRVMYAVSVRKDIQLQKES